MITLIPTNKLKPHPKNPRLVMREDVIESIKAGLADGFHPSYALQVWPQGDDYFILSGHHRTESARRHGIQEVPCFVREDLDEDEAYMVLATANAQGELSPLEIGMHALHYVEKATGGRGQKGGLSAYAEAVGRKRQNVESYRDAAEVAGNLHNDMQVSDLLTKAAHLAAIHKLPEESWSVAVEAMLKHAWSAKDTAEVVDSALKMATKKRLEAILRKETSPREIQRIDEMIARYEAGFQVDQIRQAWRNWCESEDPVDVKEIQSKRVELEEKEASIREAEAQAEAGALPNLVLADPPWRYDFAETDSRQIENQYPSATAEEICDMKPETQPDAVLFLWATVAKLREAFEVMDAWGFEYKTSAVWDKEKIGMGYWFRGQHELLLVGTRGKFSPPDESSRVSSVFREPRGKHSAKPVCVYEWLESAFPAAIKLEMFCRSPRAGWKTHGNESK
jgi:N6-adenosine-specific RNA methylase IME4/ParB-like chromosome segregation protein Spo0J